MRQRYRLRLKIAIWVSSASTRAAVNTNINNGYYFSLCLVWSAQHTQCNTEIIRDPLTVSFSSGITRAYHINKEVYKYSVHLNTSCYYTYYYFSSFVVVYSSSPLLFWPPPAAPRLTPTSSTCYYYYYDDCVCYFYSLFLRQLLSLSSWYGIQYFMLYNAWPNLCRCFFFENETYRKKNTAQNKYTKLVVVVVVVVAVMNVFKSCSMFAAAVVVVSCISVIFAVFFWNVSALHIVKCCSDSTFEPNKAIQIIISLEMRRPSDSTYRVTTAGRCLCCLRCVFVCDSNCYELANVSNLELNTK